MIAVAGEPAVGFTVRPASDFLFRPDGASDFLFPPDGTSGFLFRPDGASG